eukprot:500092-Pelagomonas_calceolata.AAC.2
MPFRWNFQLIKMWITLAARLQGLRCVSARRISLQPLLAGVRQVRNCMGRTASTRAAGGSASLYLVKQHYDQKLERRLNSPTVYLCLLADDSAGIKGKEATHPQRQNTSATQQPSRPYLAFAASCSQHEAPSEGGMQGMQAHSKDAEEEVVDTAAAIQAAEAAEEQHRCRLCKLTVELDRVVAAQEAGYVAGLFAMLHAEEMAKSDLLVGIPKEQAEWACMHSMFK